MTDQLSAEELEKQTTDTEPPPRPHHGFLEQFEVLSASAFEKLEEIVVGGLTPSEKVTLVKVALKFTSIVLSNVKEEDFTDEAKAEIESLILSTESNFSLSFPVTK